MGKSTFSMVIFNSYVNLPEVNVASCCFHAEGSTKMHIIYCWLVLSTPLKNMKVCWDDYSQYVEK
jgi:hypothetical protein